MCQTTNPRAHLTNISYHKDELKLKPFSMCIQKPAQSQLLGHTSHATASQVQGQIPSQGWEQAAHSQQQQD